MDPKCGQWILGSKKDGGAHSHPRPSHRGEDDQELTLARMPQKTPDPPAERDAGNQKRGQSETMRRPLAAIPTVAQKPQTKLLCNTTAHRPEVAKGC